MAKVLIVDDSALSRRIMRGILEPAGHQVAEAPDGIVALEKYFLDRPDLVLLDLMMHGLSGLEVLGKLRELDPGARVVVASADIQGTTHEMAVAAGALDYVTKPLVAEKVLKAVNGVLNEAERT